MAVRKIKVAKKQDILVPAQAVTRLLDIADGDVALAYLYILSHDGNFDDASAASAIKMSGEKLCACLDILAKNGLIDSPCVKESVLDKPDTLPEYTAGDVSNAVKTDENFSYLLDFTQQSLGKILSTVDTQTLLGIYSWMGLPADVICLLITSCINDTRAKYGQTRKPTMRTIEQQARIWLNLGIMTQAQAEAYLKEKEKRSTRLNQIAHLLHITSRALSVTENRYLTEWVALGLSDELIEKAYDITVVNTGSLKWRYMDTILKSWHSKGFKTTEDVRAELSPTKPASNKKPDLDALESVNKLREINRKKRGERL